MKTIISICILGVALWCSTSEAHKINPKTVRANFNAANLTSSEAVVEQVCTIDNRSSQSAIGVVTLIYAGGSTTVDVENTATYAATVSSSVTAIIINGQTVNYGQTGPVILPNNSTVNIDWGSQTNYISIIDPDVIQ
ncbi:MAG: hypothetical protein ABI444_03810 [Candidatus Kapaibacterium sp.]|jgi:archaellum component FlaF (FlaF/FlaG flagellin family)